VFAAGAAKNQKDKATMPSIALSLDKATCGGGQQHTGVVQMAR